MAAPSSASTPSASPRAGRGAWNISAAMEGRHNMADQPTPADMQKGQQVAMAGAEAAANAPPAEAQAAATTAMRAERDRTELAMTDADIDRIASALSPKLVQGF